MSRFTRDVPRDKVLTVGDIIETGGELIAAPTVRAEMRLDRVIALMAKERRALAVRGWRWKADRPDHAGRRARRVGARRGLWRMLAEFAATGAVSETREARFSPLTTGCLVAVGAGARHPGARSPCERLRFCSAGAVPCSRGGRISGAMAWFTVHFRAAFRAITWLLQWPLGWFRQLLLALPWPASS